MPLLQEKDTFLSECTAEWRCASRNYVTFLRSFHVWRWGKRRGCGYGCVCCREVQRGCHWLSEQKQAIPFSWVHFCHLKNSNYSWNQEWVYYWIYICVWQSLQWFRSISSAIFPIMLLMNQWWLSMGMIKIRMSCMFLCQSMTVNLYKSYIWVLRYWADPSPLSAFCQSFQKGNHPSLASLPGPWLPERQAVGA